MIRTRSCIAIPSLLVFTACADSTPATELDAGSPADDASPLDPGCVPVHHPDQAELCSGDPAPDVRVDEWIIAVPPAPPNPVTGDKTPDRYNRVRVLRYRRDPPVDEVHAVVVFIPGFMAGATSGDPLARLIVGRAPFPVEVWALDRRENLLEDLRGMDAAERERDPEIAEDYYFEGAEIEGRAFGQLPPSEDLGFMSEWGLATFISDLRAVLDHVPRDSRPGTLFLAGHSLGGILAEIAAAWDVGDAALSTELAGLVLLDGSISGVAIDRETYHAGPGDPVFPVPGVDAIRDGRGDRFSRFFGTDPMIFAALEVAAMRALWSPAEIRCGDDRLANFLGLLYGFEPRATNAALLGLAFDEGYSPLSTFALDVGDAAGGPMTTLDLSVFGSPPFSAPADPDAAYYWVDVPDRLGCVRVLARALFAGPSNLVEWFFPSRLDLDERTVEDLAVSTAGGDWRLDEEGFRVTRASEVDVPVLAVLAERGADPAPDYYEPFRERIAPAARNGAPRTADEAFRVLRLERWSHADPVLAERDEPAASIITFIDANRVGTANLAPLDSGR